MSIYKKLNGFKKIVGKVRKDANNPFHKSKYATIESVLETIEDALADAGLGFYQSVNDMNLKTVVYDEETNETIESNVPLIISKQDMQQLGSAITYARRYGLVSMFGLEQEDDDGNMTLQNKPQQQYAKQSNEPKEYISLEQAKGLANYLKDEGQDLTNLMNFFRVQKLSELTIKQYQFAMNKIKNGEFK